MGVEGAGVGGVVGIGVVECGVDVKGMIERCRWGVMWVWWMDDGVM